MLRWLEDGERALVERHGHGLCLAGVELNFCKCSKLTGRFAIGWGLPNVELDNLGATALARIRHVHGDADVFERAGLRIQVRRRYNQVAQLECGVRQAESEGKQGLCARGVIPAISDVEFFDITGMAIAARPLFLAGGRYPGRI